MDSRDPAAPSAASPVAGTSWAQARLPFGAPRGTRDPTELLNALTHALTELTRTGAQESALRESFVRAMAVLGAEKGVLIQVRGELPAEIEILHAKGLSANDEDACRALRSCPGISPTLILKTIETRQPELIADSRDLVGPESTGSFRSRPYSVICAPVSDSLTGSVTAVIYLQNEVDSRFTAADLEWLNAYAKALGQVLTLHVSGQRRIQEMESASRRMQDGGPVIIGDSEATRRLQATLDKFLPGTAQTDPPAILVLGESGTGKELVARYLHHFSQKRSRGPLVSFNCAGLRGELAKSELFGHRKGSFTGALTDAPGLFRAANKGLLFLDEIGEMPMEGQAHLLRVIETRMVQPLGETRETPVDVQLVLATNRNIKEEVAEKRFRADLYYRISGLCVELLPLRHPTRVADIRHLLAYYLAHNERRLQKKTQGFTPHALRALLQYSWPGNVRELSMVCMRVITYAAPAALIDVSDLKAVVPDVLEGPKSPNPDVFTEDKTLHWDPAQRALRRKMMEERLALHGGSVRKAAASLGISLKTFYRHWKIANRPPKGT
jgi:transcriptional regulator with GAF, ATPase, and Fis domain